MYAGMYVFMYVYNASGLNLLIFVHYTKDFCNSLEWVLRCTVDNIPQISTYDILYCEQITQSMKTNIFNTICRKLFMTIFQKGASHYGFQIPETSQT